MFNLVEISRTLLLEQDSKLMIIKKAITKRIPITIDYRGPSPEVESGVRYDIEAIVLGTHVKSRNLVIWAYVYRGTSKKGLPDWKMFRIDRINSVRLNPTSKQFNPNKIPGFQKGKTPDYMKSLGSVITFSPYWFDDRDKYKIGRPPGADPIPEPEIDLEPQDQPTQQPTQQPQIPQDQPIQPSGNSAERVFNNISSKIQDTDGIKSISVNDYTSALRELYKEKEGEWKNKQRQISGNMNPGEGTRRRFDNESRNEFDNLLRNNNVNVDDAMLSEIINRIKVLIN